MAGIISLLKKVTMIILKPDLGISLNLQATQSLRASGTGTHTVALNRQFWRQKPNTSPLQSKASRDETR